MKTLKKVSLDYVPFTDEVLHVTLRVERNVPYVSSEWPLRILLWLSRRYRVTSAIFALQGDNAFSLNVLIICDKDFFRHWSHYPLLEYVRRLVK